MKYKSSFTKPIIIATILLLLFWAVNFMVIVSSNGIKEATVFSVFMLIFAFAFILVFVKGIYLSLENNTVKYVHMFLIKKGIEVQKIHKIQKGSMAGLYSSLSLVYEESGQIKDMKIITIIFKQDTLKQFVSDLKTQNPKIEIDQSVI